MSKSLDHGQRLKRFREVAGLSQRELAEKIGVIHSNINYWESSDHPPRSDVLVPMAKALGISVEELLGQPKPRRNGVGPTGKVRKVFEEVNRLPRYQQQRILATVEDMLIAHNAKSSSS